MKIDITVSMDLVFNDEDIGDPERGDPLEFRMLESARQIVVIAMERGFESGFSHEMEDISAVESYLVKTARRKS